jgi:DNA-binding FadR family transcriptional regulator
MDESTALRLTSALAHEERAPDEGFKEAATDLHVALSALVDNPVLHLVSVVLISLSRLHESGQVTRLVRDEAGAQVTSAHRAIVESLLAGDRAGARRRMRRHLEELSRFYD